MVGKAHARQMDAAIATNWFKELERNRSKTLEAPSWLWSSVVSLIGSHEVACLETLPKIRNAGASPGFRSIVGKNKWSESRFT